MTESTEDLTPDPAENQPPASTDPAPDDGAGREAAKYRTRLRATEAERDDLAARLEVAQTAQLDRHVADGLSVPLATRNTSVAARIAAAERAGDLEEAGRLRTAYPSVEVGPHDGLQQVALKHPGDLFTIGGLDRAACFNPDGTINTEVVQDAVEKLHRDRPELFNNAPAPWPHIDTPDVPPRPSTATWGDALRAGMADD